MANWLIFIDLVRSTNGERNTFHVKYNGQNWKNSNMEQGVPKNAVFWNKDGSSRLPQNIHNFLPNYTVSHSTTQYSSFPVPCTFQIKLQPVANTVGKAGKDRRSPKSSAAVPYSALSHPRNWMLRQSLYHSCMPQSFKALRLGLNSPNRRVTVSERN